MVRRMKAAIKQIEIDHVVVPKAWIGKEAPVTLRKRE
jgi:hypothetical protein